MWVAMLFRNKEGSSWNKVGLSYDYAKNPTCEVRLINYQISLSSALTLSLYSTFHGVG